MNKPGHLLVTERLSYNLCRKHRLFLSIGCILPDMLPYTFIRGHFWNTSYNKIHRKMVKLERKGIVCCMSFLKLGYILHYIEDFFTTPHNTWYKGTVSEHIEYERILTDYLRHYTSDYNSCGSFTTASLTELLNLLCSCHNDYAAVTPSTANDCTYISTAAFSVFSSFMVIFEQNMIKHTQLRETDDFEDYSRCAGFMDLTE